MKRRSILALILVFCLLLSHLPAVSAAGTSGTWGKNISWTFDQSTGKLVISGSGNMPSDDSSPEWDGFHMSIRSAEIKSGVTSIGPYCFYDCENLIDVSIPDTVKEIGTFAFAECHTLKNVRLPSGLLSIGNYAFDGCRALTSIDIPGSVAGIGSLVFRDCGSLSNVTMHTGLTVLGKYALFGLPITSIILPDTVKAIGEYAFSGTSLRQITLPQGLESIGDRAFSSCPYLKTITIPAGVRSVSADAFLDTNLDSMVILGSGTVFGTYSGSTYTVFGQKEADVYGLPGSEVERIIANDPNSQYTFKPMYFDDVKPGKWYFDSVVFAKENGLFNGVGKRTFAPEQSMTRAMIVQVLYNLAGDGEICENPFDDVPNQAWYANAVAWAANYGIVNGMSSGIFAPNNNVTREQIAGIVYRFTQLLGIDVTGAGALSGFPDQDQVGQWAKEAMAWAVDRRIIGGSKIGGTDYLQPKAFATRAQVAAIMMRCVLHWDDSLHNSLKIGVGNMDLLPLVQQAAEAYMQDHEDIRIEVCQSDVMTYDETPQYRYNEDAILILGEDYGKKFDKTGTTVTPLRMSPFVFATTQNNVNTIHDVQDMIDKLKGETISVCICPSKTRAGNYAAKLLSEYGIAQLSGELYNYENDVFSVEFNLSFGMSVCGTVTEYLAKTRNLHILEDSKRDGEEDLLYGLFPDNSEKRELILGFLEYMKSAEDIFVPCGLYPLKE